MRACQALVSSVSPSLDQRESRVNKFSACHLAKLVLFLFFLVLGIEVPFLRMINSRENDRTTNTLVVHAEIDLEQHDKTSPLLDKASADKRPGAPGQENDVHAVDITRVMSAHRNGLSHSSCNHKATTFSFPPNRYPSKPCQHHNIHIDRTSNGSETQTVQAISARRPLKSSMT